eukprot:scaffold48427_cov24-Tisochrysis_lutea.AAC.1
MRDLTGPTCLDLSCGAPVEGRSPELGLLGCSMMLQCRNYRVVIARPSLCPSAAERGLAIIMWRLR